jgi:hypothetical protein
VFDAHPLPESQPSPRQTAHRTICAHAFYSAFPAASCSNGCASASPRAQPWQRSIAGRVAPARFQPARRTRVVQHVVRGGGRQRHHQPPSAAPQRHGAPAVGSAAAAAQRAAAPRRSAAAPRAARTPPQVPMTPWVGSCGRCERGPGIPAPSWFSVRRVAAAPRALLQQDAARARPALQPASWPWKRRGAPTPCRQARRCDQRRRARAGPPARGAETPPAPALPPVGTEQRGARRRGGRCAAQQPL